MDEKALLDRVLEVLRAGGAEGDAYLEERRDLRLRVRDGKVEGLERADVRGLAVRAMREGRLGFVHTSAVDADGVVRAARKALELGRAGSPREDLVVPDPAGPGDGRDEGEALGLLDASIEGRPIEGKQEWAREAEAAARAVDPKIRRTDQAGYEESLGARWIANTKGLFRHYRRSYLQASVGVVAEDAGEMQPGEFSAEATRFADLPAPAEIGRRAAERGLRLLGGRPVPTGRYPVVWSPDAGWTLLVHLSNALRGDHLARKRSWLSERGEAAIGSSLVTIRDDARLRAGPASAPFDAEGVDTREVVLLEAGKVRGNLLDLASAKRLGAASNGHAHREGYEQLPGIQSTNLYLVPGETTPEEILAGVEKGLWMWGVAGWWIGMDPSNPQFSSAAYGLWIENGKPGRPVARVTVAGSLEEILGGVDAVAGDLVWDHPTKTPTFRVKELALSGT